jgi:polar amino acid transport system permease protein
MPALVAAVIWYLIICSILMVGQTMLERHFGRGFGSRTGASNQTWRARMLSLRGGGGGM